MKIQHELVSPLEKTGCSKNSYYMESSLNERQNGVRDNEPGTTWPLAGIQARPLAI